ncbi:hypothetical protein [Nocardia sp. NPDC051463]|uniref:hypothetical protein n=1 Tax=Nocardia sp. NPDC051463 TaxID=3154845 RepID=UPI00344C095D
MFPDIDADSVLRVLARTDYDDAHESQAGLFASLLLSDAVGARSTSLPARAIFRDWRDTQVALAARSRRQIRAASIRPSGALVPLDPRRPPIEGRRKLAA